MYFDDRLIEAFLFSSSTCPSNTITNLYFFFCFCFCFFCLFFSLSSPSAFITSRFLLLAHLDSFFCFQLHLLFCKPKMKYERWKCIARLTLNWNLMFSCMLHDSQVKQKQVSRRNHFLAKRRFAVFG